MAINFPNSPVGGTTYSYLGVTYVFKNTGSGTGFWQITGPGTYGLATTAEIDAGTEELKYIGPEGLAGSKYVKEDEVTFQTSLNYNGTAKLETNSSGLAITGNVAATGTLASGNITVTGTVVASGNITAFSDSRVKEDVELIDNALDKVKQVRGVTFTRNDVEDTETRHAGVIAQELQAVLPEAVYPTQSGMLSVDYGNTIGLLVEAIKELTAKVEALEGGSE